MNTNNIILLIFFRLKPKITENLRCESPILRVAGFETIIASLNFKGCLVLKKTVVSCPKKDIVVLKRTFVLILKRIVWYLKGPLNLLLCILLSEVK